MGFLRTWPSIGRKGNMPRIVMSSVRFPGAFERKRSCVRIRQLRESVLEPLGFAAWYECRLAAQQHRPWQAGVDPCTGPGGQHDEPLLRQRGAGTVGVGGVAIDKVRVVEDELVGEAGE